jgi:general secretion pathway protein H
MSVTGILINANSRGCCYRERGFTLLEMMLVVVLIGLTVTFVNLKLEPNPEDLVHREARRITALVNQLQEESVLSGRPLAMQVDAFEGNYEFLSIVDGEWKTIEDDELFRSRDFFFPIKGVLVVEAASIIKNDDADDGEGKPFNPRLVVDPVGYITPFTLTLILESHQAIISLDEFANVVIKQPVEES